MTHASFVHLRTHSAYSLSEGALHNKALVARCAEHGMPAVAVTDTNNLFGALEFSLAAREKGVQPIVGCLVGLKRQDAGPHGGEAVAPDQLLLLVQSETGYLNLLDLISRTYLETEPGHPAQVGMAVLAEHSDGLIALAGGPDGPLGRLLAEGQGPAAQQCAEDLAQVFPGRFYIELMRHGMEREERIEGDLIDLAYRLDLPLVATNDCFFATEEMFEAHDALLCIAGGNYVAQSDRRRLTPHHRFKSAEDMRELFHDVPEAVDNTLVIARRCAFTPDTHKPLLPPFPKLEGRSEVEALREMAKQGLESRLDAIARADDLDADAREAAAVPYRERLDYEIGVIDSMGFSGYFLIVADFIQWAKARGIAVGPGRGSGAGSVVAWSLTITDLDPLRFGLLFERFLNPERVSMPDFDIDFCQDRRDEVIRYVQEEYGADRVAQIITFGKLQARAVLRDVGRVLEMPYGQVDRICKMVPNNPANPVTLAQAIDGEPLLQAMRDEDEAVARLLDIGLKLEGLYRHASTHAAGVVIGDRPLSQLVPLYRDPRSDMPVTQFNMKYVEQAGLVKFDFLGLTTLTVIEKALELIRTRTGEELDISAIPLDDAATFEMLCKADSTGVFQLESSGMRDVLRKLKPDRFEDIIAVVALYRPGPMDNIPSYIARKHGEERVVYLHPVLEPVLGETFGIPIYQEQVMQMAQTLAGYTLGGADLLRRAMGKKIKAEMDAQRSDFIDGAAATHDVPTGLAGQIFEQIEKFAGYGFNKSHAAAYALVAYQTGWLKANYPVDFLAASMTMVMGNTDKLNAYKVELERQGIALLPPDVNRSGVHFTVEETADGTLGIRYALAAIKNVGHGAMEQLVAERDNGGPFADMFDFAARLDIRALNKRSVENLVKAGAFDDLNANRRQGLESVELLMRHGAALQADRDSNQVSLFGEAMAEVSRPPLPDVVDWATQDRLAQEFEAVGFYLSAHPLEAYKSSCARLGVLPWAEVAGGNVPEGRIKLAGIVGSRRITTTSRGSKMAFVAMSDASGSYEVTVFQEVLNDTRELLEGGQPLMVTADLQRRGDDGDFRLTATRVQPLDEAAASAAEGMVIYLRDPRPLDSLASVLEAHGRAGRGRVSLVVDLADKEVEIDLNRTFMIDAKMRQAVKSIPGIIDVRDI